MAPILAQLRISVLKVEDSFSCCFGNWSTWVALRAGEFSSGVTDWLKGVDFQPPRYVMILNKTNDHFTYYGKGGNAMWSVEQVGWLGRALFDAPEGCCEKKCAISPAANVVRLSKPADSIFDEDENEGPPDLLPPELLEFPSTGKCTWSFDEEQQVLRANFIEVTPTDEQFYLRMIERDDLTVISSGLASGLLPELYDLEKLVASHGHLFLKKVKLFNKRKGIDGKYRYFESEGVYSMTLKDFSSFVEMKVTLMEREWRRESSSSGCSEATFTFTNNDGLVHRIPVANNVLYVIDADAALYAPNLLKGLKQNFKMPGILPGGEHCLMNAVRCMAPGETRFFP